MHEVLKPSVGTIPSSKPGNSLSQHVDVEVSGSQAYLVDAEVKKMHKLLHRGNAVSEGQSVST